MLFSIVPRFGNTWFLLCLERLDADWLNSCVCPEALHSDCFYCMWYLLCLEWLDADWLNGCVCLEALHSDCFYCMWYLFVSRNPAFWLLLLHVVLLSCILIGWVPFFSSRWQDFLLFLHSNWLSGLEKKEASIVEMASNSFVIQGSHFSRLTKFPDFSLTFPVFFCHFSSTFLMFCFFNWKFYPF